MERAAQVFSAALAEQTRKDYIRRWRRFEAWCRERNLSPLPADPVTVMAFLADDGRSMALSTLRGSMAAIGRVHLEAGYPSPNRDPRMELYLRGLRRTARLRPTEAQVGALRIALLREVCGAIDSPLRAAPRARDRAMLLLMLSGVSSTGLASLRWGNVSLGRWGVALPAEFHEGGLCRRRSLRAADGTDPSEALRAWMDVVGNRPENGRCFFRIDSTGAVTHQPLHRSEIERHLSALVRALGEGSADVAAHRVDQLLAGPATGDLRDKAMLLVGFAGAFRRKELVGLRWDHIRLRDDGVIIHLRRSKTDVAGRGTLVGIPPGRSELTCPVTALNAWRRRCELFWDTTDLGERPVFSPISKTGQIGDNAMTADAVGRIVEKRARLAGLDGRWGGRSLRAGFISSAADSEVPLEVIARQSRHATLDNLVRYIREDDPLRHNAVDWVGM